MTTSKVWVMQHKFKGAPKLSDFAIKEETLPPIKENEALIEALWWSVDPYNRIRADGFHTGTAMIGFQVARVVESRSSKYPVGSNVVAHAGWRTHAIIDQNDTGTFQPAYVVPHCIANLPLSSAIGALGMPGVTAYFGLLDCCKPQAGETVLVNSAAGAVGSLVGQIAKIKGCRVIGYAGSDEKVTFLRTIGFDAAYNYKTEDLSKTIARSAPAGVDCYFDNVGGDFSATVCKHLSHGARICKCGSISGYNAVHKPKKHDLEKICHGKNAHFNHFSSASYYEGGKFADGIKHMAQWIQQGKIIYKEAVYNGFESIPQALIDLLNGVNIGKVVIKA